MRRIAKHCTGACGSGKQHIRRRYGKERASYSRFNKLWAFGENGFPFLHRRFSGYQHKRAVPEDPLPGQCHYKWIPGNGGLFRITGDKLA